MKPEQIHAKRPKSLLKWIIVFLLVAGTAHTLYRHYIHGIAWWPDTRQELWDVEARVEFDATGGPVHVKLALPASQPGFILQSEHTASPGYGLGFDEGRQRYADWTLRNGQGSQLLYYRAQFRVDPQRRIPQLGEPPEIRPVVWSTPLKTAAAQLLASAYQVSSDPFSFARALAQRLQNPDNQNARLLLSELSPVEAMLRLLNQADFHAREVHGLRLEDGRRRQPVQSLVQVFSGNEWRLFDPSSSQPSATTSGSDAKVPLLLWEQLGGPVLEVVGGKNSSVTFSMLKTSEPATASSNTRMASDALLSLSIHSLPIAEQSVFKTLLLLPLGALIVVALRVLVGLKTSGTFMPVLIALAFLQMSILTGLITFLLVVGAGLLLRQTLANLNLLLVARVSAVIVCVVGLVSLFSVLSFHLDIESGLKMTFFPMIILAWTIERMSILWEEEGPHEVLVQGFGSLMTATLAWAAMDLSVMRYWMFNFLGLQLIVLALILMLGSYTGYRLSELRRFAPLRNND